MLKSLSIAAISVYAIITFLINDSTHSIKQNEFANFKDSVVIKDTGKKLDSFVFNNNSLNQHSATSPSSFVYPADIKTGLIGITEAEPVDNPFDNIFHIHLPSAPHQGDSVMLEYDLFGVTNNAGISRSINNAQAIGGHFVSINHLWTKQVESIPVSQLKQGDNVIRFTVPEAAKHYYRVKDITIKLFNKAVIDENSSINITTKTIVNNKVYIRGNILVGNDINKPVQLFCNNNPVQINYDEFEIIQPITSESDFFTANLKAVLPNGKNILNTVEIKNYQIADFEYPSINSGNSVESIFIPGKKMKISFNNTHPASIELAAESLCEPTKISITSLRDIDIPALNEDLVNVTGGAKGFRFLPHGSKFNSSVKISIPYDSTLIPEGYTSVDIQTFFFDEQKREWEQLKFDTVINNEGIVCSISNHFTDMIAGIIKVPESPQTQGYKPTSIKDIKAANPSLGIDLIEPPTANNMGNASLNYKFKLPGGRHGMQPNLGIQYNNEGGNSWLGVGWNLSIPSIGIETRWGAPRYHPLLETETYTMGGEQLAPLANRDTFVPRTSNKLFHPRVEGAFNKIIRHGTNPTDYWWEVIDKEGTKNYYGGNPSQGIINNAVLKDNNGNIGFWALVQTIDLNTNTVNYSYQNVLDVGVTGGTVSGQQLYISQINYTGFGTTAGAYTVDFIRDRQLAEPKRQDIDINGRLGFKMVTADLLRKVDIKFNGQPIRSYELKYQSGAFYKTLLKSVSELDASGAIFYTHQLNYYDDVNAAGGYTPLGTTERWSPAFDNIKGQIKHNIPGFDVQSSTLSTAKSKSNSSGIALTIGFCFGSPMDKSLTVGGSISSSKSSSDGLVSMVDINGDGLPDKVFRQSGQLYYRPNLGSSFMGFGPQRPIIGVSDFSNSITKSVSRGLEVNIGLSIFSVFWGNNRSTSTTTIYDYFSDFNGDGLIDVCSNGTVYFNRLNFAGDPFFVPSSAATPHPITGGSNVSPSFLAPDTALQSQQEIDFPLNDAIRFWQAPYNGTVNINAPVQLVNTGAGSAKKDGVRVSIQTSGASLWATNISASDFTPKIPFGVSNIPVVRGQKIYFRVQSIFNGEEDLVNWDPIIQYSLPNTPAIDANGKPTNRFQASQDFVLHNPDSNKLFKNGKVSFNGNFTKGITSDTVILKIIKYSSGVPTIALQQVFLPNTIANAPIILDSLPVLANDKLIFDLHSDSYIERGTISWKPHYFYVAFTDNTPIIDSNGNRTIEAYATPKNINYNNWEIPTQLLINTVPDTISIKPLISAPASYSGTVNFTVKSVNNIYGKIRAQLLGGVMTSNIDSIRVIRPANEKLYCEFSADDTINNFTTVKFIKRKDSTYINSSSTPVTVALRDTLNAGLFIHPNQNHLGSLYRGWGQFSFKGVKNDLTPLNEANLNPNNLPTYSTNPNLYADSSLFNTILDASTANFIMMYADIGTNHWVGFDSSVFVNPTQMSSARMILHDVTIDSLMTGGSVTVVNKITRSVSKSTSLGASASIGFIGATVSQNVSKSTSTNTLDMQDLNGDRYPDVLYDNNTQYTLPTGGLSSATVTHNLGSSTYEGKSKGNSLGGSCNLPEALAKMSSLFAAQSEAQNAGSTIGVSISGGGSIGSNDDGAIASWIDINGDGLPDKVYDNGNVALNLGYAFTAPENWGFTDIEKNTSSENGINASLGISLGGSQVNGSFQFGASLQKGKSSGTTSFSDVNGDGLIDKLLINSSGQLYVLLNVGNGFSSPILWNGLNDIRKSNSVGEAFNGAFTFGICLWIIPIKIAINPNFSKGSGFSRENFQISDIDGDGFADVLQSNSDSNLIVNRSTIGRTNMLKSVQRPMGSSFTIDYERMGNSYQMPQSKWVLKNVEIADGVVGDGVDTMRSTFSYANGYYDRHERDFFGFATVTYNQLNTAASNAIYRTTVQQFLNNSYYTKGLVKTNWLQDAAGNRFTQTTNTYQLRNVIDSVYFPALIKTDKLYFEGATTAGVTTNTQMDYDALGNMTKIDDAGDGSAQDLMSAVVTYHNNAAAYIVGIPSSITVNTVAGILRKRSTQIDAKANIIQITQQIDATTNAVYDLQYDTYGNLSKITRPSNYKGQRMWYAYTYDNTVNTYVTQVNDAFGYKSNSTYDFKFGQLLNTLSMNSEPMNYQLDNKGRLISMTGPYEIAAGKPYTIKFEYFPFATVPYAITHHYDPEYNADINTVTFMDGLGRALQVKKQVSIFTGKNLPDDVRMTVSGRVFFDAFGRTIENRYPVTEAIGAINNNLNNSIGLLLSKSTFDVLDRNIKTILADNATTINTYSTVNNLFSTLVTDPLNNKRQTLTDVRERTVQTNMFGGPNGTITTKFEYNAVSDLIKVFDVNNNVTIYTYDNLGRKLSIVHPDVGLTQMKYDAAGNVTEKITPQIRKEIPNGGAIKYAYDYERLSDIDYPRQYQNHVTYKYGAPNTGAKTGRLILQMDASGGEEFFYGKLGEVIKNIRTVMVNNVFYTTYVSEQTYDTWNRITKMIYPDGEIVKYHYNKGGSLLSMDGGKTGNTYKYVNQIGYDEYEQRVYLQYGNGTETNYDYDSLRRRITSMEAFTITQRPFIKNSYTFDAVSNILSVVNNDTLTPGINIGGYAKQDYTYDNLYRLTNAKGKYVSNTTNVSYELKMSYDNLYNITKKDMLRSYVNGAYSNNYIYNSTAPHQPTKVGNDSITYDYNGNMRTKAKMQNFWDEENRLMANINNGVLSRYTYDAGGERIIKSSGNIKGNWLNGAPAGLANHDTNYTAYISPYLVCRRLGFTKHYYIESQRIATKVGTGRFTNISFPSSAITAGGINYLQRYANLQKQLYQYYASLGISPGPPIDKYYYAHAYNSGIAAPVLIDSSSNTVPPGWPNYPGNTTPPPAGPPIYVQPIPGNDSVKAGYGFVGTGGFYEQQQYFYHPDHLGSTSFVTNVFGQVCQHQEYSGFGETFIDEHIGSSQQPYLFNAKERDAETGLYYYGARYYDAGLSIWLTIDQKFTDRLWASPYIFCNDNPLSRVDPDGKWDVSVHLSNDRVKNGYGFAVVTDRNGKEVFQFQVRAEGSSGKDRMKKDGDTPFGTFDISKSSPWLPSTSKDRDSYGPNPRLNMTPVAGEALLSGRDLFRVHGGRQEKFDLATGQWVEVKDPSLGKTNGCLRAYDRDMFSFKNITDILQKNDSNEKPGKVVVDDNLENFATPVKNSNNNGTINARSLNNPTKSKDE